MLIKTGLQLVVILGLIKYSTYLVESGWIDVLCATSAIMLVVIVGFTFFEKMFRIFCILVVIFAIFNGSRSIFELLPVQYSDEMIGICVGKNLTLYDIPCLTVYSGFEGRAFPPWCDVPLDVTLCKDVISLYLMVEYSKSGPNVADTYADEILESALPILTRRRIPDIAWLEHIYAMASRKQIKVIECAKNVTSCFENAADGGGSVVNHWTWMAEIWKDEALRNYYKPNNYCSSMLSTKLQSLCHFFNKL